jgi:hypothetical protein
MTGRSAGGLLVFVLLFAPRRSALPSEYSRAWEVFQSQHRGRQVYQLHAAPGPRPIQVRGNVVLVSPIALNQRLPRSKAARLAALVFLFGHETGHDPNSPDDLDEELDADTAGGAALKRAGFPQMVIPAVIVPMLGAASMTHGTPAQRQEAITRGWNDA